MNISLRKNTIPRISRKVADNIIREVNTVFGPDVEYLIKTCSHCKSGQSVHNFYVKKHRQHKRAEDLTIKDFRHICIPCHDNESRGNKINRKNKCTISVAMYTQIEDFLE